MGCVKLWSFMSCLSFLALLRKTRLRFPPSEQPHTPHRSPAGFNVAVAGLDQGPTASALDIDGWRPRQCRRDPNDTISFRPHGGFWYESDLREAQILCRYRRQNSRAWQECEANAFAIVVLTPERLLARHLKPAPEQDSLKTASTTSLSMKHQVSPGETPHDARSIGGSRILNVEDNMSYLTSRTCGLVAS